MSSTPEIKMPIVDVRDVATAHLKALEAKGAAGKRFLIVDESMWFLEIA